MVIFHCHVSLPEGNSGQIGLDHRYLNPWQAITDVDYYVKAVEACELQMSKRIVQAAKRVVDGVWSTHFKGPYIFG